MINYIIALKIVLIFTLISSGQLLPVFAGAGVDEKSAAGSGRPSVKIIKFEPACGEYKNGDTVNSSLAFKNTGAAPADVWAGYSVCDAGNNWHDAPFFGPVNLAPGETSALIALAWKVPNDGSFTGGRFSVRMALWDAPPGAGGSRRIDFAERAGVFNAVNDNLEKKIVISSVAFNSVRDCVKPAGNRGGLLWKNAEAGDSGGPASLVLRRNSFDGAEIISQRSFAAGRFEAVIKTPAAISAPNLNGPADENNKIADGFKLKAVTGFFLFEPVSEDEITIEIFNDGSRRVWFSAFTGGKQSAHLQSILNFDPAADFHSYAIDYSKDGAEFFIDGRLAAVFANGGGVFKTPRNDKMKIYFNSWFPSWKEFQPLNSSDAPRGNYITLIKEVKYSRKEVKKTKRDL